MTTHTCRCGRAWDLDAADDGSDVPDCCARMLLRAVMRDDDAEAQP